MVPSTGMAAPVLRRLKEREGRADGPRRWRRVCPRAWAPASEEGTTWGLALRVSTWVRQKPKEADVPFEGCEEIGEKGIA